MSGPRITAAPLSNGLGPGEARFTYASPASPDVRIEIDSQDREPTACRVYLNGNLMFDGVARPASERPACEGLCGVKYDPPEDAAVDEDPSCGNCGHADSNHNNRSGCTGPRGGSGKSCRCNFGSAT